MEDSNANSNPQKPTVAQSQPSNEVEDQEVSAPNKTPRQPSRKHWLTIGICLLALIVLGAGAVYVWHKPKAFVAPQHVTYSQTKEVILPGQSSGSGISIQKPVELTDCSTNSKSRACYWQYIANSAPHVFQAEEDLFADPILTPVTDAYLAAINAAFAGSPTSDNYKTALIPVTNRFVNANIGQEHTYKLSSAKPYTNANIKANAWQFDITVTPKDAQANSTAGRSSYNGKVIYALGKQTAYYASIINIDYNWQGNQPTWQKVLDSLKIDQ